MQWLLEVDDSSKDYLHYFIYTTYQNTVPVVVLLAYFSNPKKILKLKYNIIISGCGRRFVMINSATLVCFALLTFLFILYLLQEFNPKKHRKVFSLFSCL